MDNNLVTLSKQYIYNWFHGQQVTPEQVEAFYGFLEWKPQHDPILRGVVCLPTGKRIYVPYSEEEALSAANTFEEPMERWREKYQQEYADLDEAALWDKFNWHYLNFLKDRRPDAAPCYAAQYTRKDGTEREFPSPDPERSETKDYIPTGRAFLLEAGWEWQAVRMLLAKVADGMDPALAFELFIRIAERANFKPAKNARAGAFIRDRLRRYHGLNKTKLGQAVGLSLDQVGRLEDKKSTVLTATEIAKATKTLEALVLELKKEAALLS